MRYDMYKYQSRSLWSFGRMQALSTELHKNIMINIKILLRNFRYNSKRNVYNNLFYEVTRRHRLHINIDKSIVLLANKMSIWPYFYHYTDVTMTTMASQITSLTVVYSTVYSDADQRKQQSSASLAFVWGIHRDRWIPRSKGQLRGKCFHLMTSSW